MALSEIARDLQSEISQALHIEADGRGQHYIATTFTFGDGDQPVVALAPNQDGWMLSDRGTTLFRLGPVDAKIQAMTVRRFPLQSTASNDEKRLPSDDLPQCSRRNVGAGIGTPSVKSLDVNRP